MTNDTFFLFKDALIKIFFYELNLNKYPQFLGGNNKCKKGK